MLEMATLDTLFFKTFGGSILQDPPRKLTPSMLAVSLTLKSPGSAQLIGFHDGLVLCSFAFMIAASLFHFNFTVSFVI